MPEPSLTWTPKGTSAYNEIFVRALYKTLLRRDPDEGGYNSWLSVLNSYGSPTPQAGYDAVAAGFTESAEYRNRFF